MRFVLGGFRTSTNGIQRRRMFKKTCRAAVFFFLEKQIDLQGMCAKVCETPQIEKTQKMLARVKLYICEG